MRFEENFHSYLIPEWEDHYVDYHHLKRLVKSLAKLQDSDSDTDLEVFEQLEFSSSDLLIFFNSDCADLDFPSPISQVFAFAIADNVTNPAVYVGPKELTALLGICARKRQDLRQLDWFQKVNSEAIDRILRKLGLFISETGLGRPHPAYNRVYFQWERVREKIRAYLSEAEVAIAAMKAEARASPNLAIDAPLYYAFIPFKSPLAALIILAGMAKGTDRAAAASKAVLSYLEFNLIGDKFS